VNGRLAIVAALEALEAGDTRYAIAVLLGALEDGPVVGRRPCSCPHCPAEFDWPGLLQAHLVFCGPVELPRAA
jgi:hypothetical protein